MMTSHQSYKYALAVTKKKIPAPIYVIKQCRAFLKICDGKDKRFQINEKRVKKIDTILKLLKMPKGLKAGEPICNVLSGFQWLFIIAVLCTVHRDNPKKRRYETAVLEIGRKNGKTFLIALVFILLFWIEPKFSYFYSVAPDGSLSREVKKAIEEIIGANTHVLTTEGADKIFKIRRDDIFCYLNESRYVPLNYSNSRLDGKLPNVFLADEVGALPNSYALEAMRSGQLMILNKLGFIISTKYPTSHNPFEDEVAYAKKILDGQEDDEKVFALLYEPDDTKAWATNDMILKHANPLALDSPEMWKDLLGKRARAILVESARENFLTKHCNIIYAGGGTEKFVQVEQLQQCKTAHIDWSGRQIYIGVDLAMSNDNCSVAMVAVDDDNNILADVVAFIPDGRIDEKNKFEKVDYRRFIKAMKCIACGDMTVDYSVIEDFVFGIEEKYDVTIMSIGYDRYNALSSAQKWDTKYTTVQIRQHSDTLHPPTKLLTEKIADCQFRYENNTLLEINFENARCTYDTNMNRYINKKKSNGKVDMVVALINAIYLLQQDVIFDDGAFFVQVI